MIKLAIVLGFVAATVASPAIVRSREEIEAFRHFLESTKTDDGTNYLARLKASPLANPEENSGKFEGDIILDDFIIQAMLREYAMGRNTYTWPDTKWPNNTVIWEFGEDEFDDEQKEAIKDGIADIEKNTCIRFQYRDAVAYNGSFVRLTGKPGGCYAHVGYSATRGAHTLNLARNTPGVGCFRHGTIVHEWLHIIGFFHMQSTHDRDNYVKIVRENLRPGTEHNFAIYGPDQVSNLGVQYDYESCLHYGPFAFSVNGEKTIVALKEHEGTMGQRTFVTEKDWLRANRHYKCPEAGDWLREAEKVRASQEKALAALQAYTHAHSPDAPAKFGELLLRIPELQRTCQFFMQVGKEMLNPANKGKDGEGPSFNLLMELLRGDH